MSETRSLKRAASCTGDEFSAKTSKLTTSTPKIKRISLNFVANRKKSIGQRIFRSESNASIGSEWSDVFNLSNSSISSQFSATSAGAPARKSRRTGNFKKIGEKLEKTKTRIQNRFEKISKNSSVSKVTQSQLKTTQHPKSVFSIERPILAKHQKFLEDCVIWEEKYD